MSGARQSADSVRADATDALGDARERVREGPGRALTGAPAVLALQRSAGNGAVSALLAAKTRSPGDEAVKEIDTALTELRKDEPGIDTVEKGLKRAQTAGIPVDLEGPKPPAAALAVTKTGFGPSSVAPKKPVPPAKPTPAKSPLGKAGAKAALPGAGKAGPVAPKAPAGGGGGGGAVPMAPAPLSADKLLQPPVAPSGTRPEEDPAFKAVKGNVGGFAKDKKAHPPATAKAKEAQGAALAPADDVAGQAKAAKAETMAAQQPGSFDKQAFITAVKQAIEAKSPKSLKEADDYKSSGKAAEVKGEVKGMVGQGKEGQAKDIEAATDAPPDASKAVPKPVTPMAQENPGQPAQIPAAGAVPKPAPAEQTNLAAGKHEANQEMAEAGVSDEQLAKSNEPEFQGALKDKQTAAAHADTAPAAFRAQEKQTLEQGKQQAAAETQAGVAGMQGAKGAALAKLVQDKGKAKSKDEQKRAEVTTKIQGIFAATEADVKKILDGLDPKVERAFEQGEAAARQAFESYVAGKMSAYKKDRYGGWLGGLRWAKDKLLGMPDKVNEFFEAGREVYLKEMDKVITGVADIVARDLTAAKQRIAQGRTEIAAYVKSLPADLQKVGGDAAKEIGDRFEQLESDVNDKQNALVETLATKYVEARKGLDERIEELQAENRGLVDKAIGAIKAVINTIKELAAMLKNVLARAASAIGDILKDPVGFLGNLVAGIKGGINKFFANITTHLKKGLMGWLFGQLGDAGIELPETFDLKGIIKLLASIFGLTWANIRNRLVKQIGEKAMSAIEKGVEIFQVIATQGVAGLWQMLLEKLGDIKAMIMEQIQDFVITKIITAGITWLISLLNPAAAFIKACKLIYDVVMFFVNNAERIMKFVNTIIDGVVDIAKGNVSAVVNKIEDVLGQMVPILIGFIASILGIGGIGEKIRSIIQKLQKPVNKALDFIIKQGLKLAGPIIRGLKGIGSKVKKKVAAGKAWVKGKADAAKGWAKKKVAGVSDAFRKMKDKLLGVTFRETFQAGGEQHEIYSKKGAPQAIFTASKNPKPSGKAVSDPTVADLDGQFKTKMTEYWRLASTMTGGPSDRPLMTQANKLWREAKAILKKIVVLTKKEMDATGGGPGRHAPHIGEPGPHRMQQSRLRPQDKGKEIPQWRMESEHVIPRELISAYFSVLPINAPVSDAEYNAMVTILMYANASKEKTTTAAVGDLASIRQMKQTVLREMQRLPAGGKLPSDLLGRIHDEVLKQFRARAKDSKSRAAAAVVAEHKTVGDARGKGAGALPTSGQIDAAFEAQAGQVEDFLNERLKAVDRQRGGPGTGGAGGAGGAAPPRPTLAVPFQMAGRGHTLKISPSGGNLTVTMASEQQLPLTQQYANARNAIDNFRHYVSTITDPKVRADFEAQILPKITRFEGKSQEDFKAVYDRFFPEGSPRGPLGRSEQPQAIAQVKPLKAEAEKLLATLRAWAAETGIQELNAAGFEKAIGAEGQKIWREGWVKAKARIDTIVGGFEFEGAKVQYRGSAMRGEKTAAKGKTHWDARDFDVDAYVVHERIYNEIARRTPGREKNGKIFPAGGDQSAPLVALGAALSAALAKEFPGVARVADTQIVLRRQKPSS